MHKFESICLSKAVRKLNRQENNSHVQGPEQHHLTSGILLIEGFHLRVLRTWPIRHQVSWKLTWHPTEAQLDNGLHTATLYCCWWCFKATRAFQACGFSPCCIRLPPLIAHSSQASGLSGSKEHETTGAILLLLIAWAMACFSCFPKCKLTYTFLSETF